jgi:ribulose kinase
MAMNGTAMGDAVAAAIKGVIDGQGQGNADLKKMKQIWEAACTAIVAHIVANAQVTAGIAVTGSAVDPISGALPVTGVTSATGKVL